MFAQIVSGNFSKHLVNHKLLQSFMYFLLFLFMLFLIKTWFVQIRQTFSWLRRIFSRTFFDFVLVVRYIVMVSVSC